MANLNAGDLIGAILNAGTNQNTQNAGLNLGDLAGLAQVIQNTKILDAEKLNALKNGVLSLAGSDNLPAAVKLKLAPLLAVLQAVPAQTAGNGDGASVESNQKAWDLIKPFLNDPNKLSSLVSLFGEYGGKLTDILKAVFLRA